MGVVHLYDSILSMELETIERTRPRHSLNDVAIDIDRDSDSPKLSL
jgi:hypothetical protein